MAIEGVSGEEIVDEAKKLTVVIKDIRRNIQLPIDLHHINALRQIVHENLRFLDSLEKRGIRAARSRIEEGEELLEGIGGYTEKAEQFFGYAAEQARRKRPTHVVIEEINAIGEAAKVIKSTVIGYLQCLQKFFHDLLENVEN